MKFIVYKKVDPLIWHKTDPLTADEVKANIDKFLSDEGEKIDGMRVYEIEIQRLK